MPYICTHVEDLGEELPVYAAAAVFRGGGGGGGPAGVLVAAAVAGLAAIEEELEMPAGAGAEHSHVVEVGRRVLLHRLRRRRGRKKGREVQVNDHLLT